jgi:AbrB family looped-hinge helix DNA binding protein
MTTVKVSQRFTLEIPRQVRKSLNLKPGQKVQVLEYDNRIEYIPVKELKTMRGFLKGIDTAIHRDNGNE